MGMLRVGWLLTAMLLFALPAIAEPFTCSAFKARLDGALVASSNPETEIPTYAEARSTAGNGTHSNWSTSALSGSLTCGAADAFKEFYVSLNVTSRDMFVTQLKRLVTLDGAVICTLAEAGSAACVEAGKGLLQTALQQMGAGFKRRASNPSGISDATPWPDITTEVTAAPTLITFAMAVRDGMVPDAARRPLMLPPAAQPQGEAKP